MKISSRFLSRFEQAKDDFKQTIFREVDSLFLRFLDELNNEPNGDLHSLPPADQDNVNIEPELVLNPMTLVQSVYSETSNSDTITIPTLNPKHKERSLVGLDSDIKVEPNEGFDLNQSPLLDNGNGDHEEEHGQDSDYDCDCSECNGGYFVGDDLFKEDSDNDEDEEEDEVMFVQTASGKRQKINTNPYSNNHHDSSLQNMITLSAPNALPQSVNSNLLRTISAMPNLPSTSSGQYGNDEFQFAIPNVSERMPKVKTISLNCQIKQCQQTFANKELLDQHMKSEHHILPYRCLALDCHRSFLKRTELNDHIRVGHSDIVQWHCVKCPSATISDHNSLMHHNYFHHLEGHFECTQENCTFSAVTKREVQRHYMHTHQHYVCHFPGCGKSFKHKGYFELHERVHSGEKPYFCSFVGCDKSFARQDILLNHERSHRGVKPYRCKWEGCQYGATKRGNVITHIRSVHFNLPRLVRDQNRLNIVDDRDPRNYLEVLSELLM